MINCKFKHKVLFHNYILSLNIKSVNYVITELEF